MVTATPTDVLPAKDVLSAILTSGGLLLTAVGLFVSITRSREHGEFRSGVFLVLAIGLVIVLGLLATAGITAWADLYGGDHWPKGGGAQTQGIALLVAVAVQPFVALAVA